MFDTVKGVSCEYDRDEQAFQPAPPASAAHIHSTVNRLEIVINLNTQDTQTLLHQHLPNRPLKNLVPCRRALPGFNQVTGPTDEEKGNMAAAMERIARTTDYAASSQCQVDQRGRTTDRSRLSTFTQLKRSDTLCVSAILADTNLYELLCLSTSPTFLAGMIADWITARHHQVSHNDYVK